MSYWDYKSVGTKKSLDNYTNPSAPSGMVEFYELEPAVVLDVILDKNHEIFQEKTNKIIGQQQWAADVTGSIPYPSDKDYSWIGRALVRLVNSNKQIEKELLVWAIPMESNISEYPLINEMVVVGKYFGKYFYSKKLNYYNFVNHNVDFSKELITGGGENRELNSRESYSGPVSKTNSVGGTGYAGTAGRYFWINKNIRAIKRHEGDTIIESRFGQSIKFGSYDDDRNNDTSLGKNKDYYNEIYNPRFGSKSGGGNPMILIRNRQRSLLKTGETLQLTNSPNPATIYGSSEEKNVGGYVSEDINHDGSSIHITSGQTVSNWVTTCYKKMFAEGMEEVSSFSPNGCSNFKYPQQDGDQIVINSDRLILSARYAEMFSYSKKRYAVVTDSEYTVDAHDQMVFTTNNKVVLNSPAIYLGEYNQTGEPAALGQTLANWLYDLCNWISMHTHWYKHAHKGAGRESPSRTQIPVEIQKLFNLRDQIHTILSRRVFITGGGFAPGQNGQKITNNENIVKINVSNGDGVPGGWTGANHK